MIGDQYMLTEDIAPGLSTGMSVEVAHEDEDGYIVTIYVPGKAVVDGELRAINQTINHRIPAGSLDTAEMLPAQEAELLLPAEVDLEPLEDPDAES